MTMIDIEYIKKWVDISEEELMERLVKDAISLQREARNNEHAAKVAERLADERYPRMVEQFLDNYDYLSKYFSKEEIVNACAQNMGINDLTRETVRRGIFAPEDKFGMIFVRHTEGTVTFKEYNGSWEREVRDYGTVYLEKNRYQSVSGGHDVNKLLILSAAPWLKDYKVTVYDINHSSDWIYVDLGEEEEHSLYVPTSAIFEKDAQRIIDCHKNYWHNYGCGKYDAREEEFLNSPLVKQFLEKVAE